MDIDLQPVDRSRETMTAEVTRRLLAYLLSGRIAPGDRIPPERKLAEALDVGRSVVREALKSLTVLGLIEVRQGDGTYLKRTDSELLPQAIEWGLLLGAKRVMDIVEARHYIEVILAGLAAERRDEAEMAEMRRCLDGMTKSSDPDEFVDNDVAFHYAMAQAARNESLLQIMRSIRGLIQVWITRVVHSPDSSQPTWEEHAAVLRAIEGRDVEAARAAMEAHMIGATDRLRRTLEAHASATAGVESKVAI